MLNLPSSIPTTSEYEALLSSNLFHTMEQYSNRFITRNDMILRPYSDKWVKDPFHQWSRQWEYAFVYCRIINSNLQNTAFILDAGSGITFFPFFLKSNLGSLRIICGDIDQKLKEMYDQINKLNNQSVEFINMNLEEIPREDESLDVVYCISVVEHTKNLSRVIDEFHRVIKPGGKLIISFDISLDGRDNLTPTKSEFLLDYVCSKFYVNKEPSNLQTLLSKPDIVTTKYAYRLNPDLLPWEKPSIVKSVYKSITKRKSLLSYPYPFSFYCLEGTK